MKYSEMIKHLDQHGFEYHRRGKGSHTIWRHPNGTQIVATTNGLPIKQTAIKWRRDVVKLSLQASQDADQQGDAANIS